MRTKVLINSHNSKKMSRIALGTVMGGIGGIA